jgi:hypothetical protein
MEKKRGKESSPGLMVSIIKEISMKGLWMDMELLLRINQYSKALLSRVKRQVDY